MKYLLAVLLPVALSGCMLELLTTTAIQGELAAKNAQAGAAALNHVKEGQARTQAEYAIRAYQAEKGSYPASLSVLVPEFLPALPKHPDGSPYGYDATSGRLLDSPAAQTIPFTAEDGQNLKRIEDAIFAYWQATSNYPPTLEALQPAYLSQVPALSSGGAFVYDPQTGAVYHPNDLQPTAAAARRAGGGGGAGPLGEVTTGIAIQGELQNMNTSGVQSARGAARRGIAGVDNSYSEQQQRAVDDIDQ